MYDVHFLGGDAGHGDQVVGEPVAHCEKPSGAGVDGVLSIAQSAGCVNCQTRKV